ncbi:G-protein coupled receptor Mth-like [Cloeon dipterum]|uniref:G-protein coupled receptor Mth-like n=1 Tax=Cloeon dipterum TaxID=197152 RepID=UPI0032200E6E
MKSSIFTLVLVLGLAFGKDFCKEELRTSVDVEDAVLLKNGTLLTESDPYPAGTFWKNEEEGHWWVCPCLLGNCIRICDKEFIEEIIEAYNETEPILPVLWDEIIETDTPLIESFKQIINAKCDAGSDILNKEDIRIWANGSMKLGNESKLYGAEHYCVHQMEGNNSIHLVHCLYLEHRGVDEIGKETTLPNDMEFVICTALSLLSSILLVILVVWLWFRTKIKSFHEKAMICYLACLAVTFIVLTFNSFLIILFDEIPLEQPLCILYGLIPLYSFHASLFWLKTMCIAFIFTYKGGSRTGKNYFAKFAIYSFGAPMVIVAVALISQLINDENSIFNPNIENGICTINGTASVWFYYKGPSLILLLANVGVLFTICVIGKPVRTAEENDQMKKEFHMTIFTLQWALYPLVMMHGS